MSATTPMISHRGNDEALALLLGTAESEGRGAFVGRGRGELAPGASGNWHPALQTGHLPLGLLMPHRTSRRHHAVSRANIPVLSHTPTCVVQIAILERRNVLDAHKHSVPGAVVGEAGPVAVRHDSPALDTVGLAII